MKKDNAKKSGAYFILPDGAAVDSLLISRDGERPKLVCADTLLRRAEAYQSHHRNTAKSHLIHYIRLAATRTDIKWDWENACEVEGIVDSIIEAAKDEIRRELYEITLEEFSEQIANNRLKVCALPGCGVLHSRKGKYCSTRCTNLAAQRAKRERDRVRKAGATP